MEKVFLLLAAVMLEDGVLALLLSYEFISRYSLVDVSPEKVLPCFVPITTDL